MTYPVVEVEESFGKCLGGVRATTRGCSDKFVTKLSYTFLCNGILVDILGRSYFQGDFLFSENSVTFQGFETGLRVNSNGDRSVRLKFGAQDHQMVR